MLRSASNLQWSPTRLPVWPTKALRDCGSPAFLPSSYLSLIHLTLTFYHSVFNFSKNSISPGNTLVLPFLAGIFFLAQFRRRLGIGLECTFPIT